MGCTSVQIGGAVAAYGLQRWWGRLAAEFRAALAAAWDHSSGALDAGPFVCGGASAYRELYLFALALDRAGRNDLALELMAELVNSEGRLEVVSGVWLAACSWLAERHWRRGYVSAAQLRADGVHNADLALVLHYGELSATPDMLPEPDPGEPLSCPGLGFAFMLYEIAGLVDDGRAMIERLDAGGVGALVEVERYRDSFCVWPAWCQEILAVQAAAPKRVSFAVARAAALEQGRIPSEALAVPVDQLQRVARGMLRP